MQGGINPQMGAFTYRDMLVAIKGAFPRMHVHAFSPMEIMYGARRTGLVPVARDFDSTGLVNPPYALPPTNVPIRSVRQRFYRGYCQFNDQAKAAVQDVLAKRSALLDVVNGTKELSSRSRNSTTKYLQEFFDDISDPAKLQEHILGHCRG